MRACNVCRNTWPPTDQSAFVLTAQNHCLGAAVIPSRAAHQYSSRKFRLYQLKRLNLCVNCLHAFWIAFIVFFDACSMNSLPRDGLSLPTTQRTPLLCAVKNYHLTPLICQCSLKCIIELIDSTRGILLQWVTVSYSELQLVVLSVDESCFVDGFTRSLTTMSNSCSSRCARNSISATIQKTSKWYGCCGVRKKNLSRTFRTARLSFQHSVVGPQSDLSEEH